MFIEIEDKIINILREKVKEVPIENITIGGRVNSKPSITVSNTTFKIRKISLDDEEGNEIIEVFNGDGANKIFKLKEKPMGIIIVESPKGRVMNEIDDYNINYNEGLIVFRNPPLKGRKNIIIRYISSKKRLVVVKLKLKAKYNINIVAQSREQMDSLTEAVIKSLTESEDEFERIGAILKPVKGEYIAENQINLTYLAEIELKVEKSIPPIEKIIVSEKHGV
ncbi:MAG: hypothetical protein QXP91_07800 [Candidatus Methanomethylicia archaeon]